MLWLKRELVAQLYAQAESAAPRECCGVLLGKNRAEQLIAIPNCASSEDYFEFDSQAQLQLWRRLQAKGHNNQRIQAIYHSHVKAAAIPSQGDLAMARHAGLIGPEMHHLIICASPVYLARLRSFVILPQRSYEEAIQLF